MPRIVSEALSVSTRGTGRATAARHQPTERSPWFTAPPCLATGATARQAATVIPRIWMEPAEYALMDAAEDRMWWYRALHRRLVAALAGRAWRRAGCRLRHRRSARTAACRAARPPCGRPGVGRAGLLAAPPPSPARPSCAAASMRCRSPMPCFDAAIAADRAVPSARSTRRRRWPNCTGCCGRAAG